MKDQVANTTGTTRGNTDAEVFKNAEESRRMVCEREGVEFVARQPPTTMPEKVRTDGEVDWRTD